MSLNNTTNNNNNNDILIGNASEIKNDEISDNNKYDIPDINKKKRKLISIDDVEEEINKRIKNISQIHSTIIKRPHESTKIDNTNNKRLCINNNIPNICNLHFKRKLSLDSTTDSNSKHSKFSKYKISNEVPQVMFITKLIPESYNEAIHSKNKNKWTLAIKNELKNLYDNNIMTYINKIPKGTNVISTKWVFNIKKDENNNISKFKAPLVARGFKQQKGEDYDLTYSPTLNTDSIKLLIALAAKFKWKIYQLDIKAAYLNANLDKPIYMNIPQGDKNYQKGFWRLNKTLYGLKQSGRQWFLTISQFLIKNDFIQIKSEQCIFKKIKNGKLVCIIGIYVDDMLIEGTDYEISNIIMKIKNEFKISNCEPTRFILGIKIEKEGNSYSISQTHLIKNLLLQYKITNIKKSRTPCTGDNNISENKRPFDITTYKSAIRSLIYLAKSTRPDISFAVHKAARNSKKPTVSDWNKVINIFKYLNSTINYKIKYNGKGNINAYTDSDFAGDTKNRKSTSSYLVMFGNSPISWNSKKQSIVATSTTEAEYIAISECIKKVLWLRNILKKLFKLKHPITVYTDNLSSLRTIENG